MGALDGVLVGAGVSWVHSPRQAVTTAYPGSLFPGSVIIVTAVMDKF